MKVASPGIAKGGAPTFSRIYTHHTATFLNAPETSKAAIVNSRAYFGPNVGSLLFWNSERGAGAFESATE